jgi:hypothetical protein
MHNLVIRGATVVNGLGHDPIRADLAVRDGRIAAIGDLGKDAPEIVENHRAAASIAAPRRAQESPGPYRLIARLCGVSDRTAKRWMACPDAAKKTRGRKVARIGRDGGDPHDKGGEGGPSINRPEIPQTGRLKRSAR